MSYYARLPMRDGTRTMLQRTFSAMLTALPRWQIARLGLGMRAPGPTLPTKLTVEELRGRLPEGWAIVPVEMTRDMHDACRGAIYRYISSMPEAERAELKKLKGTRRGYILPQRMKQSLRWKAILDCVPGQQTTGEK